MRGRLHALVGWGILLSTMPAATAEAGASPESQVPDPKWAFTIPELVKLGPQVRYRGSGSAELSAARGECVATQVVAPPPVRHLRIRATPLVQKKAPPLQAAIYREAFIQVTSASNLEGRPGRWPDALIPTIDAYAQEKRSAFPATSEGPEPVVAYVEICVPAGAPPGPYLGEVLVEALGRNPVRIPLHLRVAAYTLPATSTLPSSFGFSGLTAASGHGLPRTPENVFALTHRYALAALQHRISLHGMSMEPPAILSVNPPKLSFEAYDREVAPFLDGTALPSGARFTSIDVRMHPKARTDEQRVAYLRAYAAHLRERGWLDRAFVYLKDEPRPEELPLVRRYAQLVHEADPKLRALVTTSLVPPVAGVIDLWTPNLNCLFARSHDDYCRLVVPLAAYQTERARGARLWWYQSCGSHGCGSLPAHDLPNLRYFSGWPSYMVDHDAALNRAMGVLAFRHGIEGELYFNTVEAYVAPQDSKRSDCWRDLWRFHGNGDGTLFYPGTPERIGGSTHVPIESLRLKHLRAGLQDYEVLSVARSLGLRREAEAFAGELAPQPYEIARDPEKWKRARERLNAAIEAQMKASAEYRRERPVETQGRP
ncbi:MAG: DUF4091 domain-containing protein [Deltaproteobacteria bacterium]|nr:DUF4091 domain-containing protein [Deltaproteobacteria bacterium]